MAIERFGCAACDVQFDADADEHCADEFMPDTVESGMYHRHVHCPSCEAVISAF